MTRDRTRVEEALARDNISICDASFPSTHPATVLRITAEVAATYVAARELARWDFDATTDGLISRAESQLTDAVALYRQYFPDV